MITFFVAMDEPQTQYLSEEEIRLCFPFIEESEMESLRTALTVLTDLILEAYESNRRNIFR